MELQYSSHANRLTDADGTDLIADVKPRSFRRVEAVSACTPGKKIREIQRLKIQLGMQCNYECSYCCQSATANQAPATRTADVDDFLDALAAFPRTIQHIELWGGEPLLYFAKLRRLVPVLKKWYPDAEFSIVTNGSLLNEEIFEFILRWDLHVSVSHDGPGQALRGKDPLRDPRAGGWLRELSRTRGRAGRMCFLVVFTPSSPDILATRAWFEQELDDPHVNVDAEGIVSVYDDKTLGGDGYWTNEAYEKLRTSIRAGFENGVALKYPSLRRKASEFISGLRDGRHAASLWQKCGMDAPDQLAVDLHGRVMTCQNTGAQGEHHIGSLDKLDEVRLTAATHWSHRETCTHCPVLQLCRGSCMFQEAAHFAQSCENEYRYNMAILEGILVRVTKLQLVRVLGDIRRPTQRRTIPIRAAVA